MRSLLLRLLAASSSLAAAFAPEARGQTPIRLACVGNSITQGSIKGVSPYPVKLQQLLGSGWSVQNDGVSGCTLLKKGDKPYWTMGKLADVFAFKPNVVTVKLGTNDSKDTNWVHKADFAKDLRALVDTLRGISSKPKVWLCLPVPAWPVDGVEKYTIHGTIVENEIIPLIKQVASEKGIPTIDLHTPMLGMQAHFADGVHPDQVGQDSIAALVYRALTATTALAPSPKAAQGILRVTLPGLELRSADGRSTDLRNLRGPAILAPSR